MKDTEIQENSEILRLSAQFRSNVLLKTAVTPVYSDRYSTDTNSLFDVGTESFFCNRESCTFFKPTFDETNTYVR